MAPAPGARFRFVMLPYLAGPLMVALVLRTIEAFKVFDIIWVMTRGGPANCHPHACRSWSIRRRSRFQRAGSGASLALIVTLIITRAGDCLRRCSCAARELRTDAWNAAAVSFTVFIHVAALVLALLDPGAARLAVRDEHLARRRTSRAKPLRLVALGQSTCRATSR